MPGTTLQTRLRRLEKRGARPSRSPQPASRRLSPSRTPGRDDAKTDTKVIQNCYTKVGGVSFSRPTPAGPIQRFNSTMNVWPHSQITIHDSPETWGVCHCRPFKPSSLQLLQWSQLCAFAPLLFSTRKLDFLDLDSPRFTDFTHKSAHFFWTSLIFYPEHRTHDSGLFDTKIERNRTIS